MPDYYFLKVSFNSLTKQLILGEKNCGRGIMFSVFCELYTCSDRMFYITLTETTSKN